MVESDQGEEGWLQTDEAMDVAGSIRHVLSSLDLTAKDTHAWKWVLIALHSALQGACVCHLTGTSQPVGALTKRNTQEWLYYYDASRNDKGLARPNVRIMALPDLLKKIRTNGTIGSGAPGPRIDISDQELGWLKRFHDEIRNQFIHFSPMGWSLELSGVPALCALVARIIEAILIAGWGFRHLEQTDKDALNRDIVRLREVKVPIA